MNDRSLLNNEKRFHPVVHRINTQLHLEQRMYFGSCRPSHAGQYKAPALVASLWLAVRGGYAEGSEPRRHSRDKRRIYGVLRADTYPTIGRSSHAQGWRVGHVDPPSAVLCVCGQRSRWSWHAAREQGCHFFAKKRQHDYMVQPIARLQRLPCPSLGERCFFDSFVSLTAPLQPYRRTTPAGTKYPAICAVPRYSSVGYKRCLRNKQIARDRRSSAVYRVICSLCARWSAITTGLALPGCASCESLEICI